MAYITSDKLSTVANIFLANDLGVMALIDTHSTKAEAANIQTAITEQLPSVQTHIYATTHNRVGGITILWDTNRWNYTPGKEHKIQGAHYATGTLQRAGEPEGALWHLVATYMPTRDGSIRKPQAEEFWDALRDDLLQLPHDRTVVLGDLNAEPLTWLHEQKSERHWADMRLHDIMEQAGMALLLNDEPTYVSGSLIDNIAVPLRMAEDAPEIYTVRGVSDGDHRAVIARLHWSSQPKGRERPVGSVAHQLTEEQVEEYDGKLQSLPMPQLGAEQPGEALSNLQATLADTAVEAKGRTRGNHFSAPSDTIRAGVAQLSKPQQKLVTQQKKTSYWARQTSRAKRWSGARSSMGELIRAALRESLPDLWNIKTREGRRRAAINQCELNREKAETETRTLAEQRKGDQLLKDIHDASANKGVGGNHRKDFRRHTCSAKRNTQR